MKKNITVSIIIPTYNRKDKLNRLLKSIEQCEFPENKIEIIVVDNGSTDGTCENIVKNFPKILLLRSKTNLMSAGAREYGANHASGEYFFFIDDDNVLDNKCILVLDNYMRMHSNVGIAAPLMLDYNSPNIIWCAGAAMTRFGKINLPYHDIDIRKTTLSQTIRDVDFFPNFYIVRRELVDKGLKHDIKNFSHHWAEIDYCISAKKMGYKLATVTDAITWHDIGYRGKITRVSLYNAYDQPRSRIIFVKKHEKSILFRLYYYFILIPCAALYSFKQYIFIQKNEQPLKLLKNYVRGMIDGFLSKP